MNRLALGAAPLFGIALVSIGALAQAAERDLAISWSTGFEYSSGKYGGTEEIEDFYVPLIARLSTDRLAFELTVPYLSVTAPEGTTVTEPGNEPVSGSGPTKTASGMGDVIVGVTLYDVFYSDALGLALDLTGKVKFGTADEAKGLGTGEQDYSVRADMYKFYGQITLMGSAGFKYRGDPAGMNLENVFLGSVGGAVSLNDKSRIGLMFDYRESALSGGDAISEVSAFVSRSLSDTWHLQFYAFSGFDDSSADWGAGVMFEIG